MKKKNQELEKFKFVLDYKIKELKKQIEPRETDIKNMKEQIQEVTSHNKTVLNLSYSEGEKSTVGQELFGERFLLILSELQYCINNWFSLIEMESVYNIPLQADDDIITNKTISHKSQL